MAAAEQLVKNGVLFLALLNCWPFLGGHTLSGDKLEKRWQIIRSFFCSLIAEMNKVFRETDGGSKAAEQPALAFISQWHPNAGIELVELNNTEAELYGGDQNIGICFRRMIFG
ncbi:hypothetical protein CEK71_05045 [Methylovulum psychrotolerans]|uniref:Uncharacterized protein n=2 Tax=Methylovulum psychrotolerans TaxID=1704499 RepID=A0A1Z4BW59_9GAMM|nr:hypothetical protein CEK71_05045 [Methylovulum psychrotolerans]